MRSPIAIYPNLKLLNEEIIHLSLQAKQFQIDDIRKILGDMTFDNATQRKELEKLAHSFVLFLESYQAIPTTLNELVDGQITIHQGIQELQSKHSAYYDLTEQMSGKLDQLIESHAITITPESLHKATQSGVFHGDIDAAAERIKRADPDGALALLEQLDKRHGNELTDREKYRLFANKGHAYRQKGEDILAADCFLKALSFQPEDEEALAWASVAYLLKGQSIPARDHAQQAYNKNRNCSIAVAMYIETMPDNMTLEECEKSVPDSLSSDYQVLCQLGLRALILEDVTVHALGSNEGAS